MKTNHHISQLLYRYQCVIVPDFGAFLTKRVSAKIQESNQTFYPPKKVISFNPHLKHNDGLLANHIALQENINYDAAVLLIEQEVEFWNKELTNNGFLLLNKIGELQRNKENNLIFIPLDTINYLTSSFGLNAYLSPKIIKQENVSVFINAIEDDKVVPLISENRIKNTTAISLFKYAAIFLISASVLSVSYRTYITQIEQKETLIMQAQVQKEVQTKIQQATFFIENPIKNHEAIKKTKPFHIMAGSFRNLEFAKKELESLIKKGFDAKIIRQNPQGLYPVTFGSYTTYTEAQYNMTKIQKEINKNAWLLIEEL